LLAALERAEDQAGVDGDQFHLVGSGRVPGRPFGIHFALGVGGQLFGGGPVGLGADVAGGGVAVHDRVGRGGHDDSSHGSAAGGGAEDAEGAVYGGADEFFLVFGQAGWDWGG